MEGVERGVRVPAQGGEGAPPAAHGGAGSGSCAPAKDHDAAGMGLQHNGVMSSDSQFRVFSALGHPTRYAILAFLRDREYVKVGTIAEAVNASGSTLSGHLRTLRESPATGNSDPLLREF